MKFLAIRPAHVAAFILPLRSQKPPSRFPLPNCDGCPAGENGASMDRVMIGGRTVFRDGRLSTIDEADLRSRVEQEARRPDQSKAETFVSAPRSRVWSGHSARRKVARCTRRAGNLSRNFGEPVRFQFSRALPRQAETDSQSRGAERLRCQGSRHVSMQLPRELALMHNFNCFRDNYRPLFSSASGKTRSG